MCTDWWPSDRHCVLGKAHVHNQSRLPFENKPFIKLNTIVTVVVRNAQFYRGARGREVRVHRTRCLLVVRVVIVRMAERSLDECPQ
jgi:hypothetical protein